MGRDVLAVPGHPFDARAAGCNLLIRDGATLARGAEDVLEVIGNGPAAGKAAPFAVDVPAPEPERRTLSETAALHDRILARLGPSPVAEDQLIRDLALPAETVAQGLVVLEVEGQVQRHAGGMLSRLN